MVLYLWEKKKPSVSHFIEKFNSRRLTSLYKKARTIKFLEENRLITTKPWDSQGFQEHETLFLYTCIMYTHVHRGTYTHTWKNGEAFKMSKSNNFTSNIHTEFTYSY